MTLSTNLAAACLAAAAAVAEPAKPTSCACPCPRPADGPGLPALVHTPSARAFDLNRQGRDLYRQRRFAEARDRYRAALAADPGFLGPRLNLACASTQEQRFAEAVAEARALAEIGFVPWAREIREAADLAPLSIRPERKKLEDALVAAGKAWGASLRSALLFVGRTRKPVRLPAAGVLYLGLEQEIFAFLPASGRYRQVTAEDGRVLGFLRSPAGDKVVYLRAGKLIRSPGARPALRGVTIRLLDLPTMALSPALPIPGDFFRLALTLIDGGRSRIDLDGPQGKQALVLDGQQLRPVGTDDPARASTNAGLVLDGQGVSLATSQAHDLEGCRFTVRSATGAARPPGLLIRPAAGEGRRQRPFELAAPLGAGLRGLPFPADPIQP
jgi:hypothetical protein